mmetsp:Transcript_41069/g.95913  ORF Transcript_41069/g.95913 Transcript_41069/m.95913 type:complete len:433 (-) Transcript_41069:329-1627(-)
MRSLSRHERVACCPRRLRALSGVQLSTAPGVLASRRARGTPPALIEEVLRLHLRPGVTNLATGLAHWSAIGRFDAPPLLQEDSTYGACDGEGELLCELRSKLERENGIDMAARSVLVTSGANQAFVQALLALCDVGDEVALFKPYYFSHLIALHLCGLEPVFLDSDSTGAPSVEQLRLALEQPSSRLRACVVTSPSNPSGAVCPPATALAIRETCAAHGAWLIADEAYEHFMYDGVSHFSPAQTLRNEPPFSAAAAASAHPVVSLFTFSKSYGLAGWRVGYLTYPSTLHEVMISIQDTLPTHAARFSQRVALRAMRHLGSAWVHEQVATLSPIRELLWSALEPWRQAAAQDGLPPALKPAGGFYFLLPLPVRAFEDQVVKRLAEQEGLLLLPGRAFGAPGMLRLSYGGLRTMSEACIVAQKLERAARDLCGV